MSAREPLHQPPNPDDLRRSPPSSPDCAQVRGWLRDFVDGDLEPSPARELEHHVHDCRTCAIELARTEHERMRLLRVCSSAVPPLPALPDDFAACLVERLVLDETSMVREADVAAAVARAAEARAASPAAPRLTVARLSPVVLLLGAFAMFCVLGLVVRLADDASGPEGQSRLVVISADGTYHRGRQLGRGDGLGENQALRVAQGGLARVEWHDASSRPQPAATLRLRGNSAIRLSDGSPSLSGQIDLSTNRPVAIPMADGSVIEFGIGEYSVSVETPPELLGDATADPLASLPAELLIEVEVRGGDHARIVRPNVGATLVAAGFVGVWQGSGDTSVVAVGGGIAAAPRDEVNRAEQPTVEPATSSRLLGRVVDSAGSPCMGTDVMLTMAVKGSAVHASRVAEADGGFQIEGPSGVTVDWSMVLALPPASRPELGVLAPDVYAVLREGDVSAFRAPFTLQRSLPVYGTVRDEAGTARQGVLVVPCIVDDVFGLVLPMLAERRFSDANGGFRIDRLPAFLPSQQSLRLVLFHADLAATSVVVPERGGLLASVELPPIAMRMLRWVRMHALPSNATVDMLEEVPGLPAGAGLVRRRVVTDGDGVVPLTQVGWHPLWALYGGAATAVVRQMVFDSLAGTPRMRPAAGTVTPFATVFQPMQMVPAASLELANSYRHEHFGVPAGGGSLELAVRDPSGQAVADAQVFLLGVETARGRRVPQFLGLTGDDGAIRAAGGAGDVVVISPRRSVFVVRAAEVESNLAIVPPEAGHMILPPQLQPVGQTLAVLEMQPLDWHLPGPAPTLSRCVGEANGWEVGDLPPGRYVVRIGTIEHQVVVPSGGFATIGG